MGTRQPNAFGLLDTLGNVRQWCLDWYGDYPEGPLTDPQGPAAGTCRVLRGGSWDEAAWEIQADIRQYQPPGRRSDGIGLRVVAVPRLPQ